MFFISSLDQSDPVRVMVKMLWKNPSPWEWDDILEGNGGTEQKRIQEGNIDGQSIEGWEQTWKLFISPLSVRVIRAKFFLAFAHSYYEKLWHPNIVYDLTMLFRAYFQDYWAL